MVGVTLNTTPAQKVTRKRRLLSPPMRTKLACFFGIMIIIIVLILYIASFFILSMPGNKKKRGVSNGRWGVGNGYQLTESEVTEGMNGEGEVGVCGEGGN